jgi:hypothetical protein
LEGGEGFLDILLEVLKENPFLVRLISKSPLMMRMMRMIPEKIPR